MTNNNKELSKNLTAIDRFIYAVENGLYIDAHEILEPDWKKYKKLYKETQNEKDKEKAKAIQGLINGTTALALHFIKKKYDNYKKVWLVFEKYESLLENIDIEEIEKYYYARDLLIKINNTIKEPKN